jgi:hypothetical protein
MQPERISMANDKSDTSSRRDDAGERKLRGEALDGSERKRAVDHEANDKSRNPDTVLRVDNEEDTLYDDGLDLEDDSPILANTPSNNNMG